MKKCLTSETSALVNLVRFMPGTQQTLLISLIQIYFWKQFIILDVFTSNCTDLYSVHQQEDLSISFRRYKCSVLHKGISVELCNTGGVKMCHVTYSYFRACQVSCNICWSWAVGQHIFILLNYQSIKSR